MAPSVLAAYTRATSGPMGDSEPPEATASASGKAAPSAMVVGSRSTPTPNACQNTIGPKAASGAATAAATISGRREAANQAAVVAATAQVTSVSASQTAGRVVRRARRAPAADPMAIPLMNAAAIVANA